jgi:hypothetical protein
VKQRGPIFYAVLFMLALGASAAFATAELMRPMTILCLGTDVFYSRKVVNEVKMAWQDGEAKAISLQRARLRTRP